MFWYGDPARKTSTSDRPADEQDARDEARPPHDPGRAPDREQPERAEPVRRDGLTEVEEPARHGVDQPAVGRVERAPEGVERVPVVGAEVRRERDRGPVEQRATHRQRRPGRARSPRRPARPTAPPTAARRSRAHVRRSPMSATIPIGTATRPKTQRVSIAAAVSAAAASSQRSRPVRTYRQTAHAPAVASAIDSVSDIATALDCQSWPGSAATTAASSGTPTTARPVRREPDDLDREQAGQHRHERARRRGSRRARCAHPARPRAR